jgi:hypothetical protein
MQAIAQLAEAMPNKKRQQLCEKLGVTVSHSRSTKLRYKTTCCLAHILTWRTIDENYALSIAHTLKLIAESPQPDKIQQKHLIKITRLYIGYYSPTSLLRLYNDKGRISKVELDEQLSLQPMLATKFFGAQATSSGVVSFFSNLQRAGHVYVAPAAAAH